MSEQTPPLTTAEAVAAGWKEHPNGCSTATDAFDKWLLVDRDQRAFLTVSLEAGTKALADLWTQAEDECRYSEYPDAHLDRYHELAQGLWPQDYEWFLLTSVLRDAVSAYEVYLENAMNRVLESHGVERSRSDWAPRWAEHLTFFKGLLGVDPRPPEVLRIIKLRNLLTHRRGELRTAAEREEFGRNAIDDPDPEGLDIFPHASISMSSARTIEYLDTLGRAVRTVDPVAWVYSYGRRRIPYLLRIAAGEEQPA